MTKAIELAEAYSNAVSEHRLESLYGTSKSYTLEKAKERDESGDMLTAELRRLAAVEQELADLKAAIGDPVAWHTEDHLTDKSATTYDKSMLYRWECKGWPITALYALPEQK